jgi:CBS domain-containing protein
MSNTVTDVMTTPVVTVRRDAPFKQVVARLRAAWVGAVPVTDDCGLVVGIVCEHDLLAKKASPERSPGRLARARHRREHRQAAAATAASLMTCPAVTIRAEATTAEAARLMYRSRLASLPVVDSAGRLIGIVSQGDVLDSFTRQDADIRREVVRDVISREFLLDPQAFSVTVQDGIVRLSGQPESDPVGHLLAAAVRRVEGVVGLRDQLRYTAGRTTT